MKVIRERFLKVLKETYPNWLGYSNTDKDTNDMVDDLVKKNICIKKISYGNGYKFLSVKLKEYFYQLY